MSKQSILNGFMPRKDEMERFKTEINLSEYAAYRGYEYDRKQSYQNVIVMRSGQEKINISKGADGHWVFYSRETEKGGSIVDFVQKIDGKNLGEVRKELRPWIGEPEKKPVVLERNYQRTVEPVKKDRESVLKEFNDITETNGHRYLRARGIEKLDSRFHGKVFVDTLNNVVFPHIDREGVCCLEKRNFDFKGNSRGGDKGLWCSNSYKTDNCLVIVEAPIDAISYHILKPKEQTRYISFGGQMNDKQIEILKSAINKMPDNSTIILATDKDIVGKAHANKIASLSDNKSHKIFHDVPVIGKDWNEQLMSVKGIKSIDRTSKHHEIEMSM